MDYKVFPPNSLLGNFIKCFWVLEDDASTQPTRQRIVPDGCMEMIFHYGDLYQQYVEDGTSILQPKSFIFGQISRYIDIEPTGVTGLIAARFLPDGLTPFISVPLSEMENKAVDLKIVFGAEGDALTSSVFAADHTDTRIKIIEDFLIKKLASRATIDSVIKKCVESIFQSGGMADLSQVARDANINRRNMERKFNSIIGLSPKQLSRAVRLQMALKMLGQNQFTNLSDIAYENGYYDQSHFIKDFKDFTGISPKSFFAENLKLAALFSDMNHDKS